MQARSRTPDETEPEPMLLEQFEIALAATQIRALDLIEACRALLVRNELGPEIAKKYNIKVSSLYRATNTIRRKWDEICTAEDWVYISLAVPRSLESAVLSAEHELLKSYSENKARRGTRKRK
jgi:hypothetical protein